VIVNKKCIEKQFCYIFFIRKRNSKQNNFIVTKLETKNMENIVRNTTFSNIIKFSIHVTKLETKNM
jgi:hypothetical protein